MGGTRLVYVLQRATVQELQRATMIELLKIVLLLALVLPEEAVQHEGFIEKLIEKALHQQKEERGNKELSARMSDCLSPFVQANNAGCYYVDDTYYTYREAEKRCSEVGAHLASLETEEEAQGFIAWFYKDHDLYRQYWLSGLRSKKVWTWNTGVQVLDTLWASGQPDHWFNNGTVLYRRELKSLPTNSRQPIICEFASPFFGIETGSVATSAPEVNDAVTRPPVVVPVDDFSQC